MNVRRLSFKGMAERIDAFKRELKRRNPIGVNFYTPYLDAASEALMEIHKGEEGNPTCEYGPGVRKR